MDTELIVRDFMRKELSKGISDEYINYIVAELLNDVIDDVKETADPNFTDDDIRLAVGRVLMEKLNIQK